MTTTMATETIAPVRRSVVVRASAERAFSIFTDDFDSWWPRSHHIGSSPMKKALIEGRVGGRCYSQQEDGTDCPWGQILVWEPPSRSRAKLKCASLRWATARRASTSSIATSSATAAAARRWRRVSAAKAAGAHCFRSTRSASRKNSCRWSVVGCRDPLTTDNHRPSTYFLSSTTISRIVVLPMFSAQ